MAMSYRVQERLSLWTKGKWVQVENGAQAAEKMFCCRNDEKFASEKDVIELIKISEKVHEIWICTATRAMWLNT